MALETRPLDETVNRLGRSDFESQPFGFDGRDRVRHRNEMKTRSASRSTSPSSQSRRRLAAPPGDRSRHDARRLIQFWGPGNFDVGTRRRERRRTQRKEFQRERAKKNKREGKTRATTRVFGRRATFRCPQPDAPENDDNSDVFIGPRRTSSFTCDRCNKIKKTRTLTRKNSLQPSARPFISIQSISWRAYKVPLSMFVMKIPSK